MRYGPIRRCSAITAVVLIDREPAGQAGRGRAAPVPADFRHYLHLTAVAIEFLQPAARNGIFAAGDWRAESASETISPRRDRKSETTTREKWPQKRPSRLQVLISRFRATGWWAHQGSNLGPAD
jgi:hypothetical protein